MTKRDAPAVIAFPPLLAAMTIGLGAAFHAVHAVNLAPHGPVRMAGAVALTVGLGLLVAASSTLVRAGTNVNPRLPTLAIVSQGPFRFTRNPMYLAMCILAVGVGLLLCDLAAVLLTVPLFLVLHYGVILREESYLTSKFGDAYVRYKTKVRRWI